VLQREGDLQGIRVRRVDLARHADPFQRLRDRIDLEFLGLRNLLDAHDDAHRAHPRRRATHIDRAPCNRSRSIFSFGTSAEAACAASPAAIPEAIARSTPRNVYPLLIRNPAASPATRTPSPQSRGIMPAPSSGTRWALYSTTLPPRIHRWTAGCRRNRFCTSWISTFLRERSSEDTTRPREI